MLRRTTKILQIVFFIVGASILFIAPLKQFFQGGESENNLAWYFSGGLLFFAAISIKFYRRRLFKIKKGYFYKI
jgi:hypothetical protein